MKLIQCLFGRADSGRSVFDGLFKVPDDFDVSQLRNRTTEINVILENVSSEEIDSYLYSDGETGKVKHENE